MTEVLDQLEAVLENIQTLGSLGRERFEVDAAIRLAIERLWIHAGNLAEEHRLLMASIPGTNPGRSCIATATGLPMPAPMR